MIEELFHDQKLNLIQDRLQKAKFLLLELTGQAEFHKLQIDLQQSELGKLEAAITVAAADINVIHAELRLIRAEGEAREVIDRVQNM
jgi:hypothetical protein